MPPAAPAPPAPESATKAAAQVSFGAYQAAVKAEAPPEAKTAPAPKQVSGSSPARDEQGRFLPRSEAAQDESEDTSLAQPKPIESAEAATGKDDESRSSESDDRTESSAVDEAPKPGSPRALLLKAKTPQEVDEAFIAAFGKPASAFNINSKQWVAYRHEKAKQRAEHEQRQEQLRAIARGLQDQYGPMHEARELYQKGEVEAALKLAFGDDWNTATRKALKQYHDRDPRIEALQAEVERMKAEKVEREQAEREQAERQQNESELQNYRSQIAEASTTLENPLARQLGPKRIFQDAVLSWIQENAYGVEGMSRDEIVALAADEIINTPPPGPLQDILDVLRERAESEGDRDATNHAAEPAGAAIPVRQEAAKKRAAPKTLRQDHAAEVAHEKPVPPGPERDRLLREKYEPLLRQSTLG